MNLITLSGTYTSTKSTAEITKSDVWVKLGDFNDPVNFLELYKDKDGGNNDTGWESKEYKQLLNDSAKETDKTKREEMLKKAEEIIINDMPIAPIYFYTQLWVQDPKLKGVVVSGLGDVQYKWAHFEK